MGETACAFADGHLTEEQTIKAIYWRGRCVLNGNPPPGLMASVGMFTLNIVVFKINKL